MILQIPDELLLLFPPRRHEVSLQCGSSPRFPQGIRHPTTGAGAAAPLHQGGSVTENAETPETAPETESETEDGGEGNETNDESEETPSA